MKKKKEFIYHYHQVGGRQDTDQLPMNIIRLGPITQYRINFDQHKKFHDFFDESIVNEFLTNVYGRFVPDGEQYKIIGFAEIINYQPGEVEIKSRRCG